MKVVGRGRIVLWEGGSLWAFDVAEGRRRGEFHAHHAIQVTFSVGGRFAFHVGGDVVPGPAVVIAPDVSHAYEPVGRNALVFIDPESQLGAALLETLNGQAIARLDHGAFGAAPGLLEAVWDGPRPDDAKLASLGQQIVSSLVPDHRQPHLVDDRLLRIVRLLEKDSHLPLSASQAAEVACLSESRFSHLFVEEVGLPYRTYVLWRRLMVAVREMSAGSTLTSAAHEAGFADSAHFSRTFMRMFGVSASMLHLL